MTREQRVRIGIDVGGTFTHAVAIDTNTLSLLGRTKVPTTHDAAEGVARGVVDSLERLLREQGIRPTQVVLIAHSTTQATNALLEGDVAPVGIVGIGGGASAWIARRQTAIKPIRLTPRRFLKTSHQFIASDRVNESTVNAALDALQRTGAEVIVAAEAFSVDDPAREEFVCEIAARRGLPATATHHVSRLHGLRIRTRTAVINASMIPRMLNTADMTEKAVRDAGIKAPLMIMRSDGGVMSIEEMRRRPILTMLSGPAAGVAAALLYARVSDGIFLEVGGTSTDISVIKNGRCQIRSAEVGGAKLYVRTLDVRTVGLAGGSLVECEKSGEVVAVGPRSAHIVNLPYLSFTDWQPGSFGAATHDYEGAAYLCVKSGEELLAVTPTCASNLLGLVPEGDPARGNATALEAGFRALAQNRGRGSAADLATEILERGAPHVAHVVEALMADYKLDPGVIRLVGGGGGASAIVPYLAKKMDWPHETVENADVISAIGVALALVRDSIERTVIEPTEEDIRNIRDEAVESVIRMGASADAIEVFVEVDTKQNLLRATAEGATEIRAQEVLGRELDQEERRAVAEASIGRNGQPPQCVGAVAGFDIWFAERTHHRLWRMFPERRTAIRVLDRGGAIRWASNHANVRRSTAAAAERDLAEFAEIYTHYSDAGARIPRCFVLLANRIVDLSGLVEMRQVLEMLRIELKRHASDAEAALLVDLS